ncbi:MAG: NPCBM/NEW2 domain-containing protein [Limisphaerales bacterium]
MKRLALALVACVVAAPVPLIAETIRLDELDISRTEQDWGSPQRNKSVEEHPLTIAGAQFEHGLGTHAFSSLGIAVNGATRFQASVGIDGEINGRPEAAVEFIVRADGKPLWQSGVMHVSDTAKTVDVPLTGCKRLFLQVRPVADGIDFDHADWVDARFEYSGATPGSLEPPHEEAVVLTPPPGHAPRINGPTIVGVRPGHPFFYHIPITGDRPLTVSVSDLPSGIAFDAEHANLSGTAPSKMDVYKITIQAGNGAGQTNGALDIKVGNTIALTPPLGWNSWNCFAGEVDDAKIRFAAAAMVKSGLIDHGWTYINIDDCWQGGRDPGGMVRGNHKFPDMKALADYVHSLGLKIGIYSSPGPKTCAGFEGSYRHEQQDAEQYAAWGFDYLKYDWCSYGGTQDMGVPEHARFMEPYVVMNAALKKVDRDIVFSLCQYGMDNVWEWGAQVDGNCWRTTGDITDNWRSMSGIGFNQDGHKKFAGPGHWNDPDMLVVGSVGWGQPHPTHLTPNEQYTHISLWCLLSAPLLIGADMSHLDNFTLNLLCNDEVLAVDQDALGRPAGRITHNEDAEVWARDLADGSKAIGLFNRSEDPSEVHVRWSDLGWSGSHRVRDLWQQKDLGQFADTFAVTVPRHGVCLIRAW